MVAVRLGFPDVDSCDAVGSVGAFRLVVVFDAFLGDPSLAPGSLGSRDPASRNIEVQRQLRLPSLQPALLTYLVAFAAHHNLYCMALSGAAQLGVADHRDCLVT